MDLWMGSGNNKAMTTHARLGDAESKKLTLSEVLPVSVWNDLIEVMNRVQEDRMEQMVARRALWNVLEPYSDLFEDRGIDLAYFVFKLAYFARSRDGGQIQDVTLQEIEAFRFEE